MIAAAKIFANTVWPVVAGWINRGAREIVLSLCSSKSHPEFYQQNVTGGMRSHWKFGFDVVSKSLQEAIKIAKKLDNTSGVEFWIDRVAGEIVFSLCERGKSSHVGLVRGRDHVPSFMRDRT